MEDISCAQPSCLHEYSRGLGDDIVASVYSLVSNK